MRRKMNWQRRQRRKVLNLKTQLPKVISRNYFKPLQFRDSNQTGMKAKQEDISIISYQKSPTSHHPGPEMLFNSPVAMDSFPASLKSSISVTQFVVPVGKWETLCTLLLATR
ncbi:hypothetical protein AVEN_30247-1 [Araneus ventricosus]|uniref:Uncharacterized protein n=1 Tax=Araneus ventricosus TaxID=182803 RepID=A0A4Y2SVG0_ARAVE|nr:hypothetical protein AVEN_30247-1 [Araneus ventricosus]